MRLELMLSVVAHPDVSLVNILPADYFQIYAFVH